MSKGAKMKLHYSVLLLVALMPPSLSFAQYPYYHRDRGAVVGGLLGAVTGGAIGEKNHETAAGAAIGAAVGAVTGAAIGDSVDNEIAWRQATQQRIVARQLAKAASVQDVIAMSQAGLSESVIINHIQANGLISRPKPADLITMSNAGVSDMVIRAMQTAPLAVPPAPAPRSYPERVIVERHHYVAPPPPAWHPYHYYRPPCYHHPGAHWQFSFGH
jgi:hypothetical protein